MLKRLSLILVLALLALPLTLGAEEISATPTPQADPLTTLDAQAAKALQQLLAAESANSTSTQELSWNAPLSNNSCSEVNRCLIDFQCAEDCHSAWCSPSGCFENYCSCMQGCAVICF